jgi:serine/threonine protein kinase
MFDVGDIIDEQYEVVAILGDTGPGGVLEVRDAEQNSFALKYCRKTSEKSRKRFGREVEAMAGIHHRHVVKILGQDLDHDPPYFVMPLAQGTLGDELEQLKSNETAALDALIEVCKGVQAIHNSEVIHRDIKPSNALRMKSGRIVVSDLGIAKINSRKLTDLTRRGGFIGSESYAAPEQRAGNDVDERTDIFSLGRTLYTLLTGESPDAMDLDQVAPGLAHIIKRAIKPKPDDRYQNVGALLDAIQLYRGSKDPTANPRETLESLIQQAKEDLASNEYDPETLAQILTTLTSKLLSPKSTIEAFGSMPLTLLKLVASKYSDHLLPALQAYSKAIDAEISGYPFHYAETIAKRMEIVFSRSKDAEVRVLALRVILVAAVRLNRYAAMDIFSDMVQRVGPDEALAAAEMLSDLKSLYSIVASQVPADRLAPEVRAVQTAVFDELDKKK